MIRQVVPEWVSLYQIILRKKVEAGTLIYHKMTNKFQAAAAHQATLSKSSSQIAKDLFEFLFAGEEANSASEDTPERINEKSADKK